MNHSPFPSRFYIFQVNFSRILFVSNSLCSIESLLCKKKEVTYKMQNKKQEINDKRKVDNQS